MAVDRAIETAVQKLAGTFKQDTVLLTSAVVKSVDESKATCVCIIGEDIEVPNVLLQNAVCDGLLIVPKVDSNVYLLTSKYKQPFVAQFSDIDKVYLQVGDSSFTVTNDGKIQMNDGSYGSLIQIQKLVDKINALENLLNGFITIYNTHFHPVPALGNSLVTTQTETQQISPVTAIADIENNKITHGK